MGFVSKYENDQERLYEAATSGALSYTVIPQAELEKTRLKIEIENLQKFLALVRCAFGTAKVQIRDLEKQNAELRARLLETNKRVRSIDEKAQEKVRVAESKAQNTIANRQQQFDAVVAELDKYRFAEFKQLYEKQKLLVPNLAVIKTGKVKAQKNVNTANGQGCQLNPVLPVGFEL